MNRDINITEITYHNEDSGFFVAVTDQRESVVGTCIVPPVGEVNVDGEYTNHPTYGKQFKIQKLNYGDTETLLTSLLAAGFLTGIREHKAVQVVKTLGMELIYILNACVDKPTEKIHWHDAMRYPADILEQVNGIGPVVRAQVILSWQLRRGDLDVSMLGIRAELTASQFHNARLFLGREGLTEAILNNPYLLTTIHGINWVHADKITTMEWPGKRKIAYDAPERLAAAVREAIRENNGLGHMSMLTTTALEEARALARLAPGFNIRNILGDDWARYDLVICGEQITTKVLYNLEVATANKLKALMSKCTVATTWDYINLKQYTDYDLSAQQVLAIKTALSNNVSIITGGPGCLSGDTIININRAHKGFPISIDKLVKKFIGDRVHGERDWDLSIPTYISHAVNGAVRLNLLKAAWCSGTKLTWELTTETGRNIRATDIHPFMKDDGTWIKLKDLNIGDSICVNIGKTTNGRNKKIYPTRATKYHPYQMKAHGKRVNLSWDVSFHRLVYEAQMNDLSLGAFLHILNTDKECAERLQYLRPDTIVHHEDGNEKNNNINNLKIMTQAEHALLHSRHTLNNVLDHIGYEKVTSIKMADYEITYDIEVEDDPHNFLANGFVVHNTGKTTAVLQTILNILRDEGQSVRLCAPTGKAAIRMSEVTGYEAATLHRAFGLFAEKPLPLVESTLIIDEFSMVSSDLLYEILQLISPDKRIILIGDADQLPPVGPGEPLFQMLQAGIPQVRLDTIFRQRDKSEIIVAAHMINRGEVPKVDTILKEFSHINCHEKEITEHIVESITWLMDQGIAFEDIEILTPINKGYAGRIELNKYLQHEYNPGRAIVKGIPFRTNDKVIHIKNNYKLGVMNGEVGTVTRIDVVQHGKDLILEQGKDYFGTPTDSVWVQYPLHDGLVGYNYDNVDQLQLAYALTIHKAQGSQFPAVIVVLPFVYEGFYLRQLPYTAVTRAMKYCIVLSPAGIFQQYIRNEERVRRNSMLCQLLKGE